MLVFLHGPICDETLFAPQVAAFAGAKAVSGWAGADDPEQMARQVLEHVHGPLDLFGGPARVMASTDCGFGTFAGYGKIDPAVTWEKLGALRRGADIAVEQWKRVK